MDEHFKMIRQTITSMSQTGDVHVDFGKFNVTLGNNGIYYLALDCEIECISNCVSPEECICGRMYPNSLSFKSAIEVVNFVKLNFYNQQAEYKRNYYLDI